MKPSWKYHFLWTGLLLVSQLAYAEGSYYRLWMGKRNPKITDEKFVRGVNEVFIPETLKAANEMGLESYITAFSPETRYTEHPDEVALMVLESES